MCDFLSDLVMHPFEMIKVQMQTIEEYPKDMLKAITHEYKRYDNEKYTKSQIIFL